MTVTVRGRVPRRWDDDTVSHLTQRLRALERSIVEAGEGRDAFLAPSVPAFGPGTVDGGAGASTSGTGTTETTVETTITDTSWRRRFLVMGG